VTYERNESHSEWRRRDRLAEMSDEEVAARLADLRDVDDKYRDRYGAERPSDVDECEWDDPEDIWLELERWRAVQDEIRELRCARGE
jgi:hypothetical protein